MRQPARPLQALILCEREEREVQEEKSAREHGSVVTMQMQPNNRRQEMFQQSRLPHCVSPDLARSGSRRMSSLAPLLGAERRSPPARLMRTRP